MPTRGKARDRVLICYNRCLICGRRTPHEVCHDHSYELGGRWPDLSVEGEHDRVWAEGFDKEPEKCLEPTAAKALRLAVCPQFARDWQ
jgi:hypothetical protein